MHREEHGCCPGKVCLPCLQPSKSTVHAPLLWSRQLDLSGTVLSQILYLHWHHCHTSMCSHIPLSRRSYDLEDRLFWRCLVPSSRRAPQLESCRKRTSAKSSPLRHSRRLGQRTLDHCAWVHLGTVTYNIHMAGKTALFLHTFTCTW